MIATRRSVPGAHPCARGFVVSGVVIMRPGRGDGYLTTAEAARLVGVSVNTIYSWRNRGHLVAQGLDERGRPRYRLLDVAKAENATRQRGEKMARRITRRDAEQRLAA